VELEEGRWEEEEGDLRHTQLCTSSQGCRAYTGTRRGSCCHRPHLGSPHNISATIYSSSAKCHPSQWVRTHRLESIWCRILRPDPFKRDRSSSLSWLRSYGLDSVSGMQGRSSCSLSASLVKSINDHMQGPHADPACHNATSEAKVGQSIRFGFSETNSKRVLFPFSLLIHPLSLFDMHFQHPCYLDLGRCLRNDSMTDRLPSTSCSHNMIGLHALNNPLPLFAIPAS
jgi:hypothetical protein